MADLPISGLPDAAALDGSEEFLLTQDGASVKASVLDITQYAAGWVRPSDWPDMPADAANKICILAAVYDSSTNYVGINTTVSSGTVNIDWGDGTTDIGAASNTTINHQYSYADGDLGPVTSRGYKTAMIVITPNTGGANITACNFGVRNTTSGLQNDSSNPWLDIQINAPNATGSFTFANTAFCRQVERVNFTAIGAITSLSFQNCTSLQSVNFPSGSLASVTSLSFENCRSLRNIVFPSGSLAALTSANSMFAECSSLQTVVFPSGALANVTTANTMFQNCMALIEVNFPSGALAICTSIQNIFRLCNRLTRIIFPSLGTISASGMTSAFDNCTSCTEITYPTGKLGSVTATSNIFASCRNLRKITNCELPVSFSVADCMMGSTELNAIYTSLPTITSQTITVTNNIGTSGDNPAIATGKGWTVTGS